MNEPGRILGVDYGDARTGLALSDPTATLVQPLPNIETGDLTELIEEITRVVTDHEVKKVVVGLPLLLSGKEGARVEKTREFSKQLQSSLPVPVVEWDERLSTAEAEEILKTTGMNWKQRKKKKDTVAAVLILRSYLQANS